MAGAEYQFSSQNHAPPLYHPDQFHAEQLGRGSKKKDFPIPIISKIFSACLKYC
jgi:hypothetical protein